MATRSVRFSCDDVASCRLEFCLVSLSVLSAGHWNLENTCSVTFGAVDRTATWGGELVLVRRFFFFVFSIVHFFLSFVMALN